MIGLLFFQVDNGTVPARSIPLSWWTLYTIQSGNGSTHVPFQNMHVRYHVFIVF